MAQLVKRERYFSRDFCKAYPMAKGFHQAQRQHKPQPMPPRPPKRDQ